MPAEGQLHRRSLASKKLVDVSRKIEHIHSTMCYTTYKLCLAFGLLDECEAGQIVQQ